MNTTFIKTLALATTALVLAGCGNKEAPASSTSSIASSTSPVENNTAKPAITKFDAYTQRFADETFLSQSHATGHVDDVFFTHWKDGGEASFKLDCKGNFTINRIGGSYNYVGGLGWECGDKSEMIGESLWEDSGATYVRL